MKQLFSAFFVCLLAFSIVSCTFQTRNETSELSEDGRYVYPTGFSSMSAGSAAKLNGKCLAISVFINRENKKWETECINETLSFLEKASSFMEGEAKAHGVELDIVNCGYDDISVFECGINDMLLRDFVWTNRVFESTEYGSIEEFVSCKYGSRYYDNYFVIFHIIADERSYAVCYDASNTDSEEYFIERCVVFHTHDEKYEYKDSAYTFAHEIFHLFGADDLYVPVISEEDSGFFTELFPNDIMCLSDDIELLSVSPYTAWRVGWAKGLDKNYYFLIK